MKYFRLLTFLDSVHDYERMKIRILNGGHQVIAVAGELLSCETIADCMADPDIRAFFHKVERPSAIRCVVSPSTALPGIRVSSFRFFAMPSPRRGLSTGSP